MLSHISEETARLSHGFLGALFSVLIAMNQEPWFAVTSLCVWLFFCFLLNSFALHLFKVVTKSASGDDKTGSIIWLVLMYLLSVGLLILAFAVYGFGFELFGYFQSGIQNEIVIRIGLGVFMLFMFFTNLTGFFARNK